MQDSRCSTESELGYGYAWDDVVVDGCSGFRGNYYRFAITADSQLAGLSFDDLGIATLQLATWLARV